MNRTLRLIVVPAVLFFALSFFWHSSQPAVILAQEDPTPTPTTEEATASDAETAPIIQPMPNGDFRLVFREAFLIEQLETQILPYIAGFSAADVYVENPAIDFRPDNVIDISADAELELAGNALDLRPTISMQVLVEDNQIALSIQSVTVEGVRLPGAMLSSQLDPVQELAQEQINAALLQVADLGGLSLMTIETTEDLLIMDFNFELQFFLTQPQADEADGESDPGQTEGAEESEESEGAADE